MDLDHQQLATELVRSLRGDRSQVAFSRRLGFDSNVAYSWESGRRFPTACGFLAAARRVGVDLEALDEFARRADRGTSDWTDPAAFARWLDDLRGTTSVSDVARRAGRHRAAVARWLAGAAQPRLPDLLLLIGALTDRVLDFVAVFADPAGLASVAEAWSRLQGARALAGASPWAAAVLLALELGDYPRSPEPGWIGRRLGLPEGVEEECVALLLRAGQVRLRRGRYERVEVATVDTRSAAELRSFWAEVARNRLDAGASGIQSWNLGVVSSADLARIVEVQRRAFREVRAIVAESRPPEHVVLLSWSSTVLTGGSG